MFNAIDSFKPRTPFIIYEIIDDEVIIINNKGHYFSLTKIAAEIWTFIVAEVAFGDMVKKVSGAYEKEHAVVEQILSPFLAELIDEQLIIRQPAHLTSVVVNTPVLQNRKRTVNTFAAPELCKFTDMERLFLVDPIHEVDESGWPGSARNNIRNDRIT